MEVVGLLGYGGEEVGFSDSRHFMFASGHGLCVVDVETGPKDICWRSEYGIQKWAVHALTQRLVIAPKHDVSRITLLSANAGNQNEINLENPSSGAIIAFSFSSDGKYLLALSDHSDHRIIVWNLLTNSVLVSTLLPMKCKNLSVNPLHYTTCAAYGDEGVLICQVHEVIDEYSVKFEPIMVTQSRSGADSIASFAIEAVQWVPQNGLLIAASNGYIMHLDSITKVQRNITDLVTIETGSIGSTSSDSIAMPLFVTLSTKSIIVGYSNGQVIWYPYDIHARLGNETELLEPVQVLTLRTNSDVLDTNDNNLDNQLSSLQPDPSFETLIAGSRSGKMYKFPIHVQEKTHIDEFDEEGNENDALRQASLALDGKVVATPMFIMKSGVSLCVQSMALPVMLRTNQLVFDDGVEVVKSDDKPSNDFVHVFAAGSYSGEVSIYGIDDYDSEINIAKYLNSTDDDPFAKKQSPAIKGIASSSPKVPKLLTQFSPCEGVLRDGQTHAISAIQVLTVGSYGGARLIAVGTVDGWLEVWRVEAYRMESDIKKDFLDEMNEEESDIMGGQQEVADMHAACNLMFRRKFYNTTISLISCCDAQPLFTIASYFDKDIYVINASPTSGFSEIKTLTLGSEENKPVSVFWNEELMWVGCANGLFFTFFPQIVTTVATLDGDIVSTHTGDKSDVDGGGNSIDDVDREDEEVKSAKLPLDATPMNPKAIWESSFKSMCSTVPLYGTGGGLVVVRHDADVLTVVHDLPSVMDMRDNHLIPPTGQPPASSETGGDGDVPLVDLPSEMTNSNTVFDISNLCIAHAATTQLIATGASDGSIFIWRAKRGDISLINKYHVHCCAVLSLCFTEDASKVISTSADGSIFVVAVDRTMKYAPPNGVLFLENDFVNMAENGAVTYSDQLWRDQQMELVAAELKESFKGKSLHFKSIVENIAGRLQTLLQRNADATELEKMDLHEFVVDVKQQKSIEDASANTVALYQDAYANKNARNELVAARLRECCWDPMETHSVSLTTIQEEETSKTIASFPIERVPEDKKLQMEQVKRLRSIEVLAQRASLEDRCGGRIDRTPKGNWRSSWGANLHSSPSMISWLMNDGARWAGENAVEMILEAEKAAAAAAAGDGKEKSNADGKDDKKKKPAAKEGSNIQDTPETNHDDDDEHSQTGGDTIDSNTEIDVRNIFNLIYAPQTVRTPVQKRTQIILLKEVLRKSKSNFNKHFNVLYHEKEDVVAAVNAKNLRIEEIISELNLLNEPAAYYPTWSNIEVHESAILVDDSEITSRPYETASMREERLRLEEERRKATANEDDDGRQRALQDMMNGTLEVKRDVFAEASNMLRPEWMDEMEPSMMTDAQKKEIEEFDEKYKALQEEKAAYRKSLELEMKRLRMEIQDSKKSFDEKINSMERIKILVSRDILSQELYISRLSLSMVKREQAEIMLKSTEVEIEDNRKLRHELSTKIDRVAAAVEQAKNTLQAVQDEEKNMDRSFKRDLQTLSNTVFDQDTLKTFTTLFRNRNFHEAGADDESEVSSALVEGRNSRGVVKRRQSLKRSYGNTSSMNEKSTMSKQRGSKGGSNMEGMGQMQQAANELKNPSGAKKNSRVSSQDPFYNLIMGRDKDLRVLESHIPQMHPLNIDMDCPEGFVVDAFVWSKLQELRLARIAKEIEGKRQHTAYTELKKKLDELTAQEDAIIVQSDVLKGRRESVIARLRDLTEDLDIVVSLRQGQDEVESGAVVTDYSNARLIPSSIIKKYNVRINELGKEKINVLSRIKQFRRKMNLVDWEVKHLRLEAWHLEEYFTDSQLFRVTRDLQKIIKDGSDNNQSRARLEKIAIRKEFLKKNGDIKVAKLAKAIELLRVQMEEREYENSKFSGKIDTLKSDVNVREQVVNHSKKNADRGGDERNSTRMRKVVGRRKLVDTAQVQAEEIDYLKQELDKTRQKTFPSFVRATRNRLVYNPDERT